MIRPPRPTRLPSPVGAALTVIAPILVLVGAEAALGDAPEPTTNAAERPSFLVIIADDSTWSDYGFAGNSDVRTPNLDRLRREGLYLDHMYTPATTCSPSRNALYTGLYPIRSGAYPNHTRVKDDTRSVFTHLRAAGYRVALQNKSHVGPPASYPYEFIRGQDDFAASREFIARDASQPWLLVFASNDPHAPWTRGPEHDPASLEVPSYLHDDATTRELLAKYYGEIAQLDTQVGALLEVLDETGQAKRTLVMFLSEQGGSMPFAGKWTVWENGIRVSALVRWPGRVGANSTSHALVQYVDVAPTLLEAAGVDPRKIDTGCPDATGNTGFDGRSFLALLTKGGDRFREHAFAQHTNVGINGWREPYPIRSVRGERYKLIRNLAPENTFEIAGTHEGEPYATWVKAAATNESLAKRLARLSSRPAVEFYDLESDPREEHDLANDPKLAEVRADLERALDAWMEQQGDRGMETELAAPSRQNPARRKEGEARVEAWKKAAP